MTKVMLVEDNAQLLSLMADALAQQGYEVCTASNGDAAARLARFERFDLIVTDILMPERDGIETILHLAEGGSSAPIIAISGGGRDGGVEFLHCAKLLGAAETLLKPFRMATLVAAAQRLTGGARTSDQEATDPDHRLAG